MNRHLFRSLFATLVLAGLLQAEPPENPGDAKKPAIKPPFPDLEFEPPVLKPIEKIPTAEPAPMPRAIDASKTFEVILVAPADGVKPTEGSINIGFFNHSDRDILLQIDKRDVKLGSRYYLQLKLPREFTWREKEGSLQTTKVPLEAEGAEIVFKR